MRDAVQIESVVNVVDDGHSFIGRQGQTPAVNILVGEGKGPLEDLHVCPDREVIDHLCAVGVNYPMKTEVSEAVGEDLVISLT
jgi:hypothetical protein